MSTHELMQRALAALNKTQGLLGSNLVNHRNPDDHATIGELLGLHDSVDGLKLRRELSDALAAPVAPALAPTWLPIETAPQDGRTMLLGRYNELGKWRTMRGQWMSQECIDETWEDPEAGEPGWFETCVEADEIPNCWPINPTHWQPLPAPPEKTA